MKNQKANINKAAEYVSKQYRRVSGNVAECLNKLDIDEKVYYIVKQYHYQHNLSFGHCRFSVMLTFVFTA